MQTLVLAVSLLALCFAVFCQAPTTPYLEEVFLGKCYFSSPSTNCKQYWDTFSQDWAGMDPLQVTPETYKDFFEFANVSSPAGSTLLWSGSQGVQQYLTPLQSGTTKLFTIEHTITGGILNNLHWCGKDDVTQPINYGSCPKNEFQVRDGKDVAVGPELAFWVAASEKFARQAQGNVAILLGVTAAQDAYRETSLLARAEILNLSPGLVTSVDILVVRNATAKPNEKCGSGSLLKLETVLKSGIPNAKLNCIDDDKLIKEYVCSGDPNSPICLFVSDKITGADVAILGGLFFLVIVSGVLAGVLMTLIVIVIIYAIIQCRKSMQAEKHEAKSEFFKQIEESEGQAQAEDPLAAPTQTTTNTEEKRSFY